MSYGSPLMLQSSEELVQKTAEQILWHCLCSAMQGFTSCHARVCILPYKSGPTCMLCSHVPYKVSQHAHVSTKKHDLPEGIHSKHMTADNNS